MAPADRSLVGGAKVDGIEFFEAMLDERLAGRLLDDARDCLQRGKDYRRSNFHWDERIRKSSAAVLVRDYEEPYRALVLKGLRERGVIDHDDYSVMGYAWTRLSYIPWHTDPSTGNAVTIYLNRIWDADWGGLFLYRTAADEIRGFAPKFNCGLRNMSNVNHSTTPVTLDAPEPRFTVQLFSRRGAA